MLRKFPIQCKRGKLKWIVLVLKWIVNSFDNIGVVLFKELPRIVLFNELEKCIENGSVKMGSGLIFVSEPSSIDQPLISATEASERATLYCVGPGKDSTQTAPFSSSLWSSDVINRCNPKFYTACALCMERRVTSFIVYRQYLSETVVPLATMETLLKSPIQLDRQSLPIFQSNEHLSHYIIL